MIFYSTNIHFEKNFFSALNIGLLTLYMFFKTATILFGCMADSTNIMDTKSTAVVMEGVV